VVSPTLTTSTRLVRAATAERAELARHRERLLAAKATLREELDRIEASLLEVEDRDALLARFTGPQTAPTALTRDTEADDAQERPAAAASAGRLLRGPAIRRAAVRVLLDQPGRPEALHYRRWYERLVAAGYTVVGKDPLAVFLTQISRSPVITRGTQTGVYSLDPQASRRLRQRLDELHAELRSLASTPDTTADLATMRARRAELTSDIARTERALEEAESLLAPTDPQRATG
jgi:chaperonin cofactor prefoldin